MKTSTGNATPGLQTPEGCQTLAFRQSSEPYDALAERTWRQAEPHIVELRGCGVTFAQMTGSSFILFIPALTGRLATGVLTQQQKVGTHSENLLPPSWAEGPTWQAHTYMLFDRLALDREFLITCAGTSVFQHVLNSITYTLLMRGKVTTLLDIVKFTLGGMNGTVLSGVSQFGKTFLMRLGFSWAWNWCTAQNVPMPVFDRFLEESE